MIARPIISEEELSAFIDGELDASRASEVRSALEADASLAEHVVRLQGDMERLKSVYGPVADLPVPESWRARIEGRARHHSLLQSWRAIAAVAAALVVTLGAAMVWRLQLSPQNQDIIALALDVRGNVVHPETVIDHASQQEASAVISDALRMRIKSPDYSRLGYKLERVQVYAGAPGERPVELVYRNAQMQEVTLYVRRPIHALPASARTIPVQMLPKGDLYVCAWQGESLDAVVTGKMSGQEMLRVASASYSLPL